VFYYISACYMPDFHIYTYRRPTLIIKFNSIVLWIFKLIWLLVDDSLLKLRMANCRFFTRLECILKFMLHLLNDNEHNTTQLALKVQFNKTTGARCQLNNK